MNAPCLGSADGSFMSQTPVHSPEWGSVGQARRCAAPPLQRAASLWCPSHIISVSEGAAAKWINFRAQLGSAGSCCSDAAPVLLSGSKGFLLGWFTLHQKALWRGFSRLCHSLQHSLSSIIAGALCLVSKPRRVFLFMLFISRRLMINVLELSNITERCANILN